MSIHRRSFPSIAGVIVSTIAYCCSTTEAPFERPATTHERLTVTEYLIGAYFAELSWLSSRM